LLSSFEEVHQVLGEHGIVLGVKGVRQLAYRYAERARVLQRANALGPGETVAGRRVVVSVDGGRVRLRENKRGEKPPRAGGGTRVPGVNRSCSSCMW